MTMAKPKLKLTNRESLIFWITSILIIFTSSNMQVRTKAFQVIMNFLKMKFEQVSQLLRQSDREVIHFPLFSFKTLEL